MSSHADKPLLQERQEFRDALDTLPWKLRRLYFARKFGEMPPDSVRLVGCRRPPEHVFEAFRRIHGIDK